MSYYSLESEEHYKLTMKDILNRQAMENIAFDKGYRVNELAEYLCLNSRQFRYLFEKEIGITPKAWMKECRVRRGLNMLESGISPDEIWTKLNYSSIGHMANEIKEVVGLSPNEIQLSYRLSRGRFLK